MEKNRVAIGAVVLVAVVGIAFWAVQKESGETVTEQATTETSLLPDLSKDDIDELEISRPESPTVKLVKRDDGTWWLAEPVEAEADQTVVSTALDKLDELEMARIAATNTENHERLEVTEEKGIRVIVRGGGEVLANLFIGAYSGGNTMVRPDGEDRVAAARGSIKFAFNKDVKDWRNRRVIDVSPANVVAVSFANGGSVWNFVQGEANAWAQAEGEAPIERFGPARIQSTVSSLARRRASDFAASDVTLESAGLGEGAAVVTLTVRQQAEGEGEGEGEAPAPPDAPTETIVLRVGNEANPESHEVYAVREGDDTIYVISTYLAERVKVNLESFQTPVGGEPEEAEAPPAMPGGAMGGGPGGGGQIPPEVMRQIQQQIQQQQQAGGGAPH